MSLLALHHSGPREGLPLVLLPSFPLDARLYEPLLPYLDGIHVISVDLPGYGQSPAAGAVAEQLGRDPEPSLDTYAAALAASLSEEGVDRAVVAGVSMGGYTALALAEAAPDMIAGIGMLDTAAEADSAQAREGRLTFASELESGQTDGRQFMDTLLTDIVSPVTFEERPDVIARMREWLAEAPREAVVWSMRAMAARPDRVAVLEGLDVPGLVVWGEDETKSPRESADMMAEALGTEVTVIPRAGHMAALEAPEPVARALADLHRRASA